MQKPRFLFLVTLAMAALASPALSGESDAAATAAATATATGPAEPQGDAKAERDFFEAMEKALEGCPHEAPEAALHS